MPKNYLNINVYEAAQERIKYTFDNFENIISKLNAEGTLS